MSWWWEIWQQVEQCEIIESGEGRTGNWRGCDAAVDEGLVNGKYVHTLCRSTDDLLQASAAASM